MSLRSSVCNDEGIRMVVPLISVGLYEKQREERLLAFDRKNPPFAQTAKDGPPTSTSRRGVTLRLA